MLCFKSIKIGESAYFAEWYLLPKSLVYDFMLIMIRSNKPASLSTGKVSDLSLAGFAGVRIHFFLSNRVTKYIYLVTLLNNKTKQKYIYL